MNPHIPALLARAEQTLETARHILATGDAESAINRTYYAAFYAATAALLSIGEQPGSHAGTLSRFQALFVATGKVPAEAGRSLRRAFDLRQGVDYDFAASFSTTTAAGLVDEVEYVVRIIKQLTS